MHFCERCGIEMIGTYSKTKLCKKCLEASKSSSLENNKKIIKDARHAKAFGITYGEYSKLRECVIEMIRLKKC